jgi:phosphate transport system substrate-binding protein
MMVKNKIPYGAVKNSSGAFIKADLASVSEAAAGAAKTIPDDFRVSITDAPGKKAYPISTFTWLLIPAKFSDGAKRDAMKGFVKWAITDGQKFTDDLAYAKLPKEVVAKELKAIGSIQ